MIKRTALPLQYSRIKKFLPIAELIRLAEKAKGKALPTANKQDKDYLVDNVLIPQISIWVSCIYGKGYEKWYDHNLYRAVQKTAELLGLGTQDELATLSNEEICEKIQFILDVNDYERILHLSAEERILTLRDITPQFTGNFSNDFAPSFNLPSKDYQTLDNKSSGVFDTLFNPFNQILFRIATTPTAKEFIKQGGKFVGSAILGADKVKALEQQALFLKLKTGLIAQYKASKWKKDILKGGGVALGIIAVIAAGVGTYKLVKPKIEEKRKAKESRMVHLIAELVACLCFNPYSVLSSEVDSTYETLRRSYVAEINKVHPDVVIGLSAEQQASAYQRMKELRLAWEIIQTEKGIHPSF